MPPRLAGPLASIALGVVTLAVAAPFGFPALLTLAAGLFIGFGAGSALTGRPGLRAPAGLVDRLQALHDRLRHAEADSTAAGQVGGDPLAVEMVYKLRQMYEFSATSLERAVALHVGAREMATEDGRRRVLDQRASLVTEVAAAVGQIEAAVDRVRAAATTAGDALRHERLTDLNADLDRQLDVARRVEERMNSLEARARGDLSEAEAYVKS